MANTKKNNEDFKDLLEIFELAKTQMYEDKMAALKLERQIQREERLLQLDWNDVPKLLKQRFELPIEDARNLCMDEMRLSTKHPNAIKLRELETEYEQKMESYRFQETQVEMMKWQLDFMLKFTEEQNKKIRVLQIN